MQDLLDAARDGVVVADIQLQTLQGKFPASRQPVELGALFRGAPRRKYAIPLFRQK